MPELDPQARADWDCHVDLCGPGWDAGLIDCTTVQAVAAYLTALESERATLLARAEAAERRVGELEKFVTKALAYYEIQGEYSDTDDSVRIYDDDLHARYKKAMDAYYDEVRALRKALDAGQEGGKGG